MCGGGCFSIRIYLDDKTDDQDVVKFLLQTEMIPLCLNIMERGTELSRTVATFIVQKILFAEVGLAYICQTFERFSHVALILVMNLFNTVIYNKGNEFVFIYIFFFPI